MKFKKNKHHFPILSGLICALIVIIIVYQRLSFLSEERLNEYSSKTTKTNELINSKFNDFSINGKKNIQKQTVKIIKERLETQAEFLSSKVSKEIDDVVTTLRFLSYQEPNLNFMKNIYENNSHFREVSFINQYGKEIIKVSNINPKLMDITKRKNTFLKGESYWSDLKKLKENDVYYSKQIGKYVPLVFKKNSKIQYNYENVSLSESAYAGVENPRGKKYTGIIRFVIPAYKDNAKLGYYSIALNTDYIRNIVDSHNPEDPSSIRILPDASNGSYAFMQDKSGTTISHPRNELIMGLDELGNFVLPWRGIKSNKEYLPNLDQLKKGKIPTDCRFLDFAPHCKEWLRIYSNKKTETIEINWAGKKMYSTISPILIRKLTGEEANFGFIVHNYNIQKMNEYLDKVTSSFEDVTKKGSELFQNFSKESKALARKHFIQLIYTFIFLIIILISITILTIVIWYIQKKQTLIEKQKTTDERILFNTIKELSNKVIHDIRSPLTSLEYLVKSLSSKLAENERIIANQSIERISDILSTLGGKKAYNDKSEAKVEIIDPLVKRIISEKRLEFETKSNVEIRLKNELPYGTFVNINKADFFRTMSNLVNNSAEASIPNKKLIINVTLESSDNECKIIIQDNGKGIAPENIKTIFQHGISIDKPSGSGIGLTSAKETIEKYKGSLILESEPGLGTIVTIKLPVVPAPLWFKTTLDIFTKNICIIDDDESIHSIWNEILSKTGISISHIRSSQEFESWIKHNNSSDYCFLFDLELLGSKLNGLDLMKKYNLQPVSTLVTSHYDNSNIQMKAQKMGVKIIPKDSAANIKINFNPLKKNKMVLIEDDRLIQLSWRMAANKKDIELATYFSIDDFLKDSENFPKDTSIYIDSILQDGTKGEIESKRIFDLGFVNLTMASGMDFDSLPYWIKGNQGKAFPEI